MYNPHPIPYTACVSGVGLDIDRCIMGGSSWVGERDSTLVLVAADLSHEVTNFTAHVSKFQCERKPQGTDCPLLRMCEPLWPAPQIFSEAVYSAADSISFFAASFCLFFFTYLLFMHEQWQQQEKVRPGNEATHLIQHKYTVQQPKRALNFCFFQFLCISSKLNVIGSIWVQVLKVQLLALPVDHHLLHHMTSSFQK